MKVCSKILAGCVCFAAVMSGAQAEIALNGFASVGGGHFSAEKRGAGYEGYDQDAFTADPAIKIGVQVSAQIDEKVSATGQLLAKGSNDYNVESEWAYITYAAQDNWDVRVGRLRSPFFPYSDFLDVGYAYPWIEPPQQVYRFLFTTVEGIDTLYRSYIGDWDYTAQVYYGRLTDETVSLGEEVGLDLKDFAGANISFTRDWLTLRASYNRADFSIESPTQLEGLLTVLDTLGFTEESDAVEIADEKGEFWGVSAQIDYEDWLLNAEYTELLVDQSVVSDDKAWYVMLGRRFDEVTVHATYSKQESDTDYSIFDDIPDGVAVPPAGITDLKETASDVLGNTETETLTLGVRYDFAIATAFKFEVTDIDFKSSDADGTLVNFSIDTVF